MNVQLFLEFLIKKDTWMINYNDTIKISIKGKKVNAYFNEDPISNSTKP